PRAGQAIRQSGRRQGHVLAQAFRVWGPQKRTMPAIPAVSSHVGLLFLMTERSVGQETQARGSSLDSARNFKIWYCGATHPFLLCASSCRAADFVEASDAGKFRPASLGGCVCAASSQVGSVLRWRYWCCGQWPRSHKAPSPESSKTPVAPFCPGSLWKL